MMNITPSEPPEKIKYDCRHPATLLATWFGSGLLPKAPGTWGSLAALPFAWVIATYYGQTGLLIASIIVFIVGIWVSDICTRITGSKDPGEIVIDEVAGVWLTLCVVPPDLLMYAIGFIFFRIFDIYKPWPVSWADTSLKGGIGIMVDDIFAAIYAAAYLYGIYYLMQGTVS